MNDCTSQSLYLPPNPAFQCRESKSGNSILFICNLPSGAEIEFATRSPSCGALHENEPSAQDDEEEEFCVDPNFFDTGYTMAGATGFTIWTGTRLLIESVCWSHENCTDKLRELQARILNARVIELGAGVGVVGTYLAGCGADVLVTDLPTLVENAIDDNLERNKNGPDQIESSCNSKPPLWLGSDSHRIGQGWAKSVPLDWTIPILQQLTPSQCQSIDIIIASDVVFLVSMLESLLDTVASLFETSFHNNPSFILSFQRRDSRDGDDSTSFTTVNRVIREVKKRGWSMDCLAWRPVNVLKEKGVNVVKDESQVFVFEVRPAETNDARGKQSLDFYTSRGNI